MKKMLALALLVLVGCQNTCARTYGGTSTVKLEPGEKLVNATWKTANLWVLTRKAHPGEEPETHVFREYSNWGLVEGKVVFVEQVETVSTSK